MKRVWADENKFAIMRDIEVLVCEAQAKEGRIPKSRLKQIKNKAKFTLARIKELEKKTNHDVVAFVTCLCQNLGKDAQFLHLGLTSSDLLDTAFSLQLQQASGILIQDLNKILRVLTRKIKKYKDTACIGRTHGVHAEPITLGFKLALWFDELKRQVERLKIVSRRSAVGKISGAVGTYAHIDPKIEAYVCRKLNLKPVAIATQVISRDIYAEYLLVLSLIASSLEKFATEIRHLQKTEVLEIEEPFGKGQKGSSAMPHKRNPIICERICGLARVLRANALAAMEDISLWHERDISHSSVERIIFPDSCIALDYMLNKFLKVTEGFNIYPLNLMANLVRTRGLIFSGRVLLELMKKGLSRTAAYNLVQECAMGSWENRQDFKEVILDNKAIAKYLAPREIDNIFDLDYYLRHIPKILKRLGLK